MARPILEHSLSLKSNTIKFLCSYGGRIVPRYPDGKLRYHGGHTRVLSVHRSISFSELMLKMKELCGASVTLRCQLPTEDLDALISIKTDEDLRNLIEEYDLITSSSMKIRAFLSPISKPPSSPLSSSLSSPSPPSPSSSSLSPSSSFSAVGSSPGFVMQQQPVMAYPVTAMCYRKPKSCQYCCRYSSQFYLVHNKGNHLQK